MRLRLPYRPVCAGLLAAAFAANPAPASSGSPFLPIAPTTPAQAPAEPPTFEVTGIVRAGEETFVALWRVKEKRSLWLKVGDESDGVAVESHDPLTDEVVVRLAGGTRKLRLKNAPKSSGASGPAYFGSALPVATIEPPPPITNEEKEREARMLVSDLLEIGMIQRKAYEEAQRKAAREAAEKAKSASRP